MGSFKTSLIDNPSELLALPKICADVYHPLTAAPTLRVESHPDLDDAWRSAVDTSANEVSLVLGSTKDHDRVFKNIVYHLDRVSRYRDSVFEGGGDDPGDDLLAAIGFHDVDESNGGDGVSGGLIAILVQDVQPLQRCQV